MADRMGTDIEDWSRRRHIRDGRERSEAMLLKTALEGTTLNNNEDEWVIKEASGGKYSSR